MTSPKTEIITMQSATVYNFFYLILGKKSIAEAITIKAVAMVYEKLYFADIDTFLFKAIKYAYRHGKLKSKKAINEARGGEFKNRQPVLLDGGFCCALFFKWRRRNQARLSSYFLNNLLTYAISCNLSIIVFLEIIL
jgi:hypothetical protein